MTAALALLREVAADENGATLVEYGLILMLIAGVCLAVLGTLGANLSSIWTKINAQYKPIP